MIKFQGMEILAITELSAFLLLLYLGTVSAWLPDVRPDLQPKHHIIISKFIGNNTDYFKILAHDEDSLLIGARDILYNVSLNGLLEISRLEWYSSDADRQLCTLKGKHERDCHNYIRVFARIGVDKIIVCGTNSYKPQCRHYVIKSDLGAADHNQKRYYENVKDLLAQGICQYNPSHNSTYIYTGGHLYSATAADFSGIDALIYRETLRTEQYDLNQLNQPNFVGVVERNGYVMFFFREISREYMNCGKVIYSRVGRVCKNDRGGPYSLSKSWTSFLKTRLNCSVPGEYPFYFDEIQAISDVIEKGSSAVIYAVFTTSVNAISGSAVCAFNVDDILTTFKGGFKVQEDSQFNWLPIQSDEVPRPGQCVDDSRMLSTTVVNFVKNHPLMQTAVSAVYNRPLLTKVNLHHRLTAITVDRQVMALNGNFHDVIYAGTDDGKITKFFNIVPPKTQNGIEHIIKTVVISELQVLPIGVAIRELFVAAKINTLVVVSEGSLVTVPLYYCSYVYECQECLTLQDPNCAWDLQNHECKKVGTNKFVTKAFIQSLNSTKKTAASLCPKPGTRTGSHSSLNPIDIIGSTSNAFAGKEENVITIDRIVKLPDGITVKNSVIDSDEGDYLLGMKGRPKISDKNGDHLQMNGVNEQKLQLDGKRFYWGFAIVALALVFITGMFVGLYSSRRVCKATAFYAKHRNQLGTPRPFTINHNRNSGKDVNLLVNTDSFVNQKKANVDIVGEKDRSHECKNSTENLEKEIPYKTSTLTKVKRTYI